MRESGLVFGFAHNLFQGESILPKITNNKIIIFKNAQPIVFVVFLNRVWGYIQHQGDLEYQLLL